MPNYFISIVTKLHLTTVWRFVAKINFEIVWQFCSPLLQIGLNLHCIWKFKNERSKMIKIVHLTFLISSKKSLIFTQHHASSVYRGSSWRWISALILTTIDLGWNIWIESARSYPLLWDICKTFICLRSNE